MLIAHDTTVLYVYGHERHYAALRQWWWNRVGVATLHDQVSGEEIGFCVLLSSLQLAERLLDEFHEAFPDAG